MKKDIIIFGAGQIGRIALLKYGNRVKYFIDNNESIIGNRINGVIIKSVQKGIIDADDCTIVIASKCQDMMEKQLKEAGAEDRRKLEFHRMILDKKLPYTIGGGIGQSRLCMYFLRKAHIGEVQAAIWPEDMIKECSEHNIFLL